MSGHVPEWNLAAMPPSKHSTGDWHLLRAEESKVHTICVVSDGWLGCYTHHPGNRTVPCINGNCVHCDEGKAPRWYGFFLAVQSKPKLHLIYEFTDGAANNIKEIWSEHQGLRGLVLQVRRRGGRKQGTPIFTVVGRAQKMQELRQEVPMQPILARIWEYHASVPFNTSIETESEIVKRHITPPLLKTANTGHDNEWLTAAAAATAEQLTMPLEVLQKTSSNGNGRAGRK